MNASGVVKAMSNKQVKTRFGMKDTYSFNIDDQWYSLGFKKPKFGKGDTIEFAYSESTYGMQVDDKTVSVKGGGGGSVSAAPASTVRTASFGGKGVFPIPALDGQRAIVRQNALTNARELYCSQDGGEFSPSAAHDIIAVARIFESYACGDLDAKMAEEMVSKRVKKEVPKPIEEILDEEEAA